VETSATFRGVRVVGGDLAIDLVNTRTGPRDGNPDGDVIKSYDDLIAWAQHLGILTTHELEGLRRRAARRPAAAVAAFERATATRDALDRVFRALASGDTPRDADLDRLARDEADGLSRARLTAGHGYDWSWEDHADLERPLWPVVHAAVALLTGGPLDRVKGCASCRFLFVDESRNHSRRWCSMDDCGTQDKMRAYVARRRAARTTDA